jgi:hypothetical protein
MSLTVYAAARPGTSVVAVSGVVDQELTVRIADAVRVLTADAETVVIDLSDATLTSADVTRALASRLARATCSITVVNHRLSARRMLRRFGHPSIALCSTLEAALGTRVAS